MDIGQSAMWHKAIQGALVTISPMFDMVTAQTPDKAVVAGKQTVAAYKKSISAYRILTATYVEMGHMEDAKAAAAKIMELKPKFTLSKVPNTPFQNDSDLERYYSALRKSGLPE